MVRREYQVRFTTPAFLGNAGQDGQWRTPPFKALLRQWWRVVYAADQGFQVDLAAMRREEGLLFGNAWLSHREGGRDVADHCKSLVRIRLDSWELGTETRARWGRQELQPAARVLHPEVGQIGPLLYLGYGPLVVERVPGQGRPQYATVLKPNAAIQAGASARLAIAMPDAAVPRLDRALALIARYGTLGGRSRNGWGSFTLAPLAGTPALAGALPTRDWQAALGLDWPHAIGADRSGPLIWATAPQGDWKALMRTLAMIKIGLRTQFVFPNAPPPHHAIEPRHWLSYPITGHGTRRWDRNARLPNSLRLKVRPTADDPARLVGVIVHVPCQPTAGFQPDLPALTRTWQAVHDLLDELTRPTPARTYGSIADPGRRAALKAQLDGLMLTRIAE